MIKLYITIYIILSVQTVFAQDKYFTKQGSLSFFSHSLVEDIKADNNQVLSITDTATGEMAVQLLMRSFQFKKALMREHFNENYVESYKYPKALFRGRIMNYNERKEKSFEAEITGTLTVHGIEKEITTIANITKSTDGIILTGDFVVKVADFDIKIPAIVVNNIAKNIKITYELRHKPYKQ